MPTRETFRSLQVRDFRRYLVGYAFVTTGMWMQRVAQAWLVLDLTGSAFAVGVTVTMQFLPVLLMGLHGGWLVDRVSKQRLLRATGSAMCLLAGLVGILTLTGRIRVEHIYVIAALLGLVTVVDNPGRQLLVSETVGRQRVRNAVSLASTVYQLGGLVGPALCGLLISQLGIGWSLAVTAGCFLPSLLTTPATAAPDARADAAVASRRPQVRQGLRYVLDRSQLLWPIVLVGFVGSCSSQLPVVLSAFSQSVFASGASGYGALCSALALGSIVGALGSARRGHSRLRQLVASAGAYGAALVVASFAPTAPVLAVLLVAVGAASLTFLTAANATVQLGSDPWMRGQVMSVYLLASVSGVPVGGLLIGSITDQLGPRVGLLGCGIATLLAAVVTAHRLARREGLCVRLDHSPSYHLPRPAVQARDVEPARR